MSEMEQQQAAYEQGTSIYGGYEGEKAGTHQQFETASTELRTQGPVEKVYPVPSDTKNIYRLIMFGIAMITLLLCAVLFIFFMGGTGGWIGFAIAAGIIFLITAVAFDKIQ